MKWQWGYFFLVLAVNHNFKDRANSYLVAQPEAGIRNGRP